MKTVAHQRAITLYTIILGAVEYFDWRKDGDSNPDTALLALGRLLKNRYKAPTDAELIPMTSALAVIARSALASGQWRVREDYDSSLIHQLAEQQGNAFHQLPMAA